MRTWLISDVDWYADLVGDADVMRFIGDGRPRALDAARREIDGFRREQAERGWSRWVIETSADRRCVGFAGFSARAHGIDWGGRLARRVWGSKIALVAAVQALEAGLIGCGIETAIARTDERNLRAWRLNLALGFSAAGDVELDGARHVVQTIHRDGFLASGHLQRNRDLLRRFDARSRAVDVAA